ncbi:superoxide dismutase, Ni [Candidatus Woesearchaeota archaeon]|nr:superoxide dismutase, Ni [Candidatus Woesearchaeota archaeon]
MKIAAKIADKFSKPGVAYAHCDIPCGIYDPHAAQVAAHTVVRMAQLIGKTGDDAHAVARYAKVKEEHAELCKHEIRIIWGDYFKPEMLEKHKELHGLVWNIMKAASKARQEASAQAAEELLEQVNRFAEIFWETKGVKTYKTKAPYPTEKEIVLPRL